MWSELCKSFLHLTRYALCQRRADVMLYYPRHFNRSADGHNPYFAPIVALCEEQGLKWIAIEEPDDATSCPRDERSIPGDAFFFLVTALRKVIRWFAPHATCYDIDRRVARIVDALTFHRLRARRYITISNSMLYVLSELNPNGRAYDLQHGVIYNGHGGYFTSADHLHKGIAQGRRGILLWGPLYREAFRRALTAEQFRRNVRVVGYPIPTASAQLSHSERRHIVISLQITADSEAWRTHSPLMLRHCLNQLRDCGYPVLLKHHPRFNNVADLTDILPTFPFASFTSQSLAELASAALLHITWSSTTTFEFANYGVPTFLLHDDLLPFGKTLFYDQYSYPLYRGMTLREVVETLTDSEQYAHACRSVKDWYDSAYAPFDRSLMTKILLCDEEN